MDEQNNPNPAQVPINQPAINPKPPSSPPQTSNPQATPNVNPAQPVAPVDQSSTIQSNPNNTFYPPTNNYGQQSVDNLSPADMPPEPNGKSGKKKVGLIIISLILILIIIGGAYGYYIMQKNGKPKKVFDKALSNSLSTNSIQQTTTSQGAGSITYKADLSNIKNITLATSGSINASGAESFSFASYSSPSNTYFKYTAISVSATDTGAKVPNTIPFESEHSPA